MLFMIFSKIFAIEENEIRIEANIFEANEKERISIFSGNVRIYKGSDEINSSTVKISFTNIFCLATSFYRHISIGLVYLFGAILLPKLNQNITNYQMKKL